MKTWHKVLIGAVGGPLVGIPIVLVTDPALDGPLVYPVVQAVSFLGRNFFPNHHGDWSAFLLPVSVLYFAFIGAFVAIIFCLFKRKHSA